MHDFLTSSITSVYSAILYFKKFFFCIKTDHKALALYSSLYSIYNILENSMPKNEGVFFPDVFLRSFIEKSGN